MKITFDVSERLERVALLLVQGDSVVYAELSKIQRRITQIMSAIDNLKQAVDSEVSASQQGFSTIGSAMEELASDIQGLKDQIASLPSSEAVQAEADRLATNAQTITDAFNNAAQQIRDALPTAAPTPDEPPANQAEGGGEVTEG